MSNEETIKQIQNQTGTLVEALYKSMKKECRTYGELRKKVDDFERESRWCENGITMMAACVARQIRRLIEAEINAAPINKIMFLCDGRQPECKSACKGRGYENCTSCNHTFNIGHAKNFIGPIGDDGLYKEKEQ